MIVDEDYLAAARTAQDVPKRWKRGFYKTMSTSYNTYKKEKVERLAGIKS